MTRDEITTRVHTLVREHLQETGGDVDAAAILTDDTNLIDALGFDSLDVVEYVMACEDTFDLEVPDEDMENIKTVGAVVDLLVSKLSVSA